MKNKCLNLELRDYFKKAMSLATAVMFTFVGAHATVAKSEEDVECGKVEYKVEYSIRDEYKEAFREIINNKFDGFITQEQFIGGYMTVNQYMRESETNIRVQMLNKELVTIDHLHDFSEEFTDEIDKEIIHEMFVRMVNLSNATFISGKTISVEDFIKLVYDFAQFIEGNKSAMTKGGAWALKNAGYGFLSETINVFAEENIKNPEFAKIWFSYFDKKEYNATNKFVLIDCYKETGILNNGECQSVIVALVDTRTEISNRVKEVNRDIAVLSDDCNRNNK